MDIVMPRVVQAMVIRIVKPIMRDGEMLEKSFVGEVFNLIS